LCTNLKKEIHPFKNTKGNKKIKMGLMSQVKETSKKFDALAKLDENEFMQANPSVKDNTCRVECQCHPIFICFLYYRVPSVFI